LVEELVEVLGSDQVSTNEAVLESYAVDQAPVLDFHLPEAVVFARSAADVQAVVKLCGAQGVTVVPRGAGTGVSGGAHASRNCVVLSLERMNRILDLNPDDETAVVEPGVINAALNEAAAEHGLMYAPDPASFRTSTIGGNVALRGSW
jgi:glycolate oxidase